MARTRVPRTRPTSRVRSNTLVASAAVLTAKRDALAPPEAWQAELWERYDDTPELRFGVGWLANALSRVRLYVGRWSDAGDTPMRIDLSGDAPTPATAVERAAVDVLAQLCEGPTGQAQMMAEFATHLSLPGVGYLVGIPRTELPRDEWLVLSQDEIGTQPTPGVGNGWGWTRRVGDSDRDVELLPADTLVVRVWRPHKRRHWTPDSPARAQIPVLRELSLLTAHVEASATSRLAGAGILLLPTELTFPVSEHNAEAEDPFLAEFIEVTTKPIKDRGSASAVVPYPLRVPGEFVDKVKHLSFATPLDEKAIALREEAIRRFATGMDLPAEVVLGLGDSNHWTAWQVEESALKLHVEPAAETITQALTIGYLGPALLALGFPESEWSDLVVWHDATELTMRPDRSQDAKDVFDRNGIGMTALRRETGFGDEDAPTDEELTRSLLLNVVAAAPSLFPIIAPMLGLDVAVPEGVEPLPTDTTTAPVDTAPVTGDAPADGPPAQPAAPPPGDPGAAALLAASDVLVQRALERAGNRLLSGLRRTPSFDLTPLADVPVTEVHVHLADPTGVQPLDQLLDGAWSMAPEVAARWEVDPAALVAALDGYTRGLLAGRQPHRWDRMVELLGDEL